MIFLSKVWNNTILSGREPCSMKQCICTSFENTRPGSDTYKKWYNTAGGVFIPGGEGNFVDTCRATMSSANYLTESTPKRFTTTTHIVLNITGAILTLAYFFSVETISC